MANGHLVYFFGCYLLFNYLFIDDDEDSPGGKKDHEVENQAIAQTIVFSFIQRKRHPSFKHFLIPNILISPTHF